MYLLDIFILNFLRVLDALWSHDTGYTREKLLFSFSLSLQNQTAFCVYFGTIAANIHSSYDHNKGHQPLNMRTIKSSPGRNRLLNELKFN